MAVLVDDEILWFEVSMDDLEFMEMLNGQNNLGKIEFGFGFIEIHFFLQSHTKVTSWKVLKDKDMTRLLIE